MLTAPTAIYTLILHLKQNTTQHNKLLNWNKYIKFPLNTSKACHTITVYRILLLQSAKD